ncbi:hypothetical protein SAY87_026394 [Trapa incisa]|uniref:Peroxidase n=1 Tax=Trapa incisa TaxID=236973 RepID=A0AAN7H2D1_9MYRT|nr:hypothetical protein SAY87_026394 [Trapa incisa]
MAFSAASASSSFTSFFLVSYLLLLAPIHFQVSRAHYGSDGEDSGGVAASVPLVNGLSWTFYKHSCPKAEFIVREYLRKIFEQDIGQAAGLLRLHFHDCFVQGCDGSVLLDGSASGPGEKDAPPNLSLRGRAFEIINELRDQLENKCGRVVSCSDIAAMAARDSVYLSGGPDYPVPLGRRDGLAFATMDVTLANLPSPNSSATTILSSLATKGFTATDVVALSGGHTIGIGHCASFDDRLHPTQDPVMEPSFAGRLRLTCPTPNVTNTTVLDVRSPNTFDNKYYVNLVSRQGLFTSDQDLYTYAGTKGIVAGFAENQSLFFKKFIEAMTKMGQLGVLTGKHGEIRANCSVRNSDNLTLLSVIEEDMETAAELK